jgi:Fic/DOC family protein
VDHTRFAGDRHDLHKQRLERRQMLLAKLGDRAVRRKTARRQHAIGDIIFQFSRDPTGRKRPRGIGIQQHRHHHLRVEGLIASPIPFIGRIKGLEIQCGDGVGDEERQVPFGKPVTRRGREQQRLVGRTGPKCCGHTGNTYDPPGVFLPRRLILAHFYSVSPTFRLIFVNHIRGVFVVVFLEIHPFQDGNGRLSRALTTLLLLRAGYAYVPYSSLESVIEQSKDTYYLALRRTQKTTRSKKPDWQPWVMFFLRALQQQKRRLESRVEREKKILGQLPELSLRICELTKERGQVKVEDIARATGAARGTVKDHLNRLIKGGYLVPHGRGKGTWYSLP